MNEFLAKDLFANAMIFTCNILVYLMNYIHRDRDYNFGQSNLNNGPKSTMLLESILLSTYIDLIALKLACKTKTTH